MSPREQLVLVLDSVFSPGSSSGADALRTELLDPNQTASTDVNVCLETLQALLGALSRAVDHLT